MTGVDFNKFTLVIVLRTEWRGVDKDRDKNPVRRQNYNPGRCNSNSRGSMTWLDSGMF